MTKEFLQEKSLLNKLYYIKKKQLAIYMANCFFIVTTYCINFLKYILTHKSIFMKHFFTKLLLLGMLPITSYAQTIVSTQPENKKVILEEFTGIHCVYCPQGHVIAETIINNNPGNAFAINIHQGSYANPSSGEPDFRTPFGNAIANQTGLTGYPAGTVNRHVFPGLQMGNSGTTALGRGEWTTAANQILATASYLNMAVEATLNVNTRELSVHVESYYTGDSPQSSNWLNVALLQNNTKGPQVGGNQGDQYVHMRRLVHLLTGQWGDEVLTTTQGSFVDKNYTYTIPADYNGIEADISEMQIVVFMTETHQEIISGNGTFPTYSGLEFQNDLAIRSFSEIDTQCSGIISPVVEIQNQGQDNITSATIEYSINSELHTYNWVGNLASYQKETIELPEVNYSVQDVNILEIALPTDENNSNNTISTTFERAIQSTNNLTLHIQTDQYGNEVRWNIKNASGAIIQQGGPYANNQTFDIPIELSTNDCYTFNLTDTYGDGGGPVSLVDSQNTTIYSTNGSYGTGASTNFSNDQLGTYDLTSYAISLYPNPTSGIVNVNSKSKIDSITVYDLTGKTLITMKSTTDTAQIDLSGFAQGTYVVKIASGSSITTKKVIVR